MYKSPFVDLWYTYRCPTDVRSIRIAYIKSDSTWAITFPEALVTFMTVFPVLKYESDQPKGINFKNYDVDIPASLVAKYSDIANATYATEFNVRMRFQVSFQENMRKQNIASVQVIFIQKKEST